MLGQAVVHVGTMAVIVRIARASSGEVRLGSWVELGWIELGLVTLSSVSNSCQWLHRLCPVRQANAQLVVRFIPTQIGKVLPEMFRR